MADSPHCTLRATTAKGRGRVSDKPRAAPRELEVRQWREAALPREGGVAWGGGGNAQMHTSSSGRGTTRCSKEDDGRGAPVSLSVRRVDSLPLTPAGPRARTAGRE